MKFQHILACTLLLIASATCDDGTTAESDTCVPGEEYKVSCNTCLCPESGRKEGSGCTLKACPEEEGFPTLPPLNLNAEDAEKCEPGTSFSTDDCNTCICPEDGKKSGAACTAIGCGPKSE